MATDPIMADSATVIRSNRFPPAQAALVAQRMLARFNRAELSNAIEVLVTMLDIWDGDPDLENCDLEDDHALTPLAAGYAEGGPGCAVSDAGENAWTEWHTMRGSQKGGPNIVKHNEDDEEDDPSGQYDEDCHTAPTPDGSGPGCAIADPGGCEHDGREYCDHGLGIAYGIDQSVLPSPSLSNDQNPA